MEQAPCIICYRITPNPSKSGPDDICNVNDPAALTRFFSLLGRHLDDGRFGGDSNGTGESMRFQFEKFTSAGMVSCCVDCSKIVDSFCQLYHQMKSIELSLNLKLWTLKDIIQCGKRMPSRMQAFRERVAQINNGDDNYNTPEDIIDLKEWLVTDCMRKLQSSLPKLEIQKCDAVECPRFEISSFLKTEIDESSNLITYSSDDGDPLDGMDTAEIVETTVPNVDTSLKPSEILPRTESNTPFAMEVGETVTVTKPPNTGEVDSNLEEVNPQHLDQEIGEDQAEADYIPPIIVIPPEIPLELHEPKSSINLESGKLTCTLCHKQYQDNYGFEIHWKSIHLKLRYVCSLCKKEYTQQAHYERHCLSTHMRGSLVVCQYCDMRCVNQTELIIHQQRVHLTPRSQFRYSCKACSKKFSQSCNVSRHQKVCPAINPNVTFRFACEICQEKFYSVPIRAQHQAEAHNGNKFKCDYCDQTFAIRAYKYIHKRTCPMRPPVNPD